MNASLCLVLCSILVIGEIAAQGSYKSGNCPMRNTVSSCTPRCMNDYDCSFDKKCCPNKCGSMSCAQSSAVNTGNDGGYKGSSGSVYCGGVKCGPYEKCVFDRSTKRDKCART
ncbi:waprin-Phi2 [Venturia canescens]|uniref:waprin-Phi2 n=1 Tax=Venturia canescens TaxID=32260 RepID=UPI001C9C4832|nr:waprin-Phi2-like [Venturia canescens]